MEYHVVVKVKYPEELDAILPPFSVIAADFFTYLYGEDQKYLSCGDGYVMSFSEEVIMCAHVLEKEGILTITDQLHQSDVAALLDAKKGDILDDFEVKYNSRFLVSRRLCHLLKNRHYSCFITAKYIQIPQDGYWNHLTRKDVCRLLRHLGPHPLRLVDYREINTGNYNLYV